MTKKIPLEHPGTVLLEEFLEPYDITPSKLAALIGVDRRRTYDIVNGKRPITADTAMRLGLLFGNSPRFWMNMQSRYDLELEQNSKWSKLRREIKPIKLMEEVFV
jgi:addiction module HigA family antidote